MRTLFITLSLLTIITAETFHVPDDFPTIQAGINSIDNGDILLVEPGFYSENINFLGKDITVASHFYLEGNALIIERTMINGSANGPVVTFETRESNDAVLMGFSIINGYDSMGGGIHISEDSSPTIINSKIYNNIADDFGGGVYVENSSPVFHDVKIYKNSSDYGDGGGVYCINSNAAFDHVTVHSNTAASSGNGLALLSSVITLNLTLVYNNHTEENSVNSEEEENETERNTAGGGIYANATILEIDGSSIYGNSSHAGGGINAILSDVEISDSYIYENRATNYNGGGLRFINCSGVTIKNSDIFSHHNEIGFSSGSGAGIYVENSVFDMYDSNIYDNHSSILNGYGGGIFFKNANDIQVKDSKINGNTARIGGGIFTDSSTVTIKRVFLTNNEASNRGGGLFSGLHTDLKLTNVTIADNTASNAAGNGGGGIYSPQGDIELKNGILWDNTPEQIKYTASVNANHFLTVSYSNVMDGINGIDMEDDSYLQWLEGNINTDPLFNNPEELDYTLTFPSPCINAGDPDTDGDGIPFEPYPDDLDPDGSPADMGAEYYPLTLGDTDDDQIVTVLDLIIIKNIILAESWGNFFNSQLWTADYNQDNIIDITDIIEIVQCIIFSNCDDLNMSIAGSGEASINTVVNHDDLSRDAGESLSIIINSDVPLIGVQFEMNYDTSVEQLTDVEKGQIIENFEMGYSDYSGHVKAVIYPEDELLIPPGEQEILILHFESLNRSDQPITDVQITHAILLDENGNPVSIHQNDDESKKEITVFTGFPNPFNPVIRFGFYLPEEDHVKIEIYDVNGKSVAVVCDAYYSTGNFEVSWDGSDYASGMYFAKLLTTQTEISQKIMLLK